MADQDSPQEEDLTDRVAMSMLTLRVNTPAGEWLSPDDEELFHNLYVEVLAADPEDGEEYLVLTMMNLAWHALANLAAQTGRPMTYWLQQIAMDTTTQDDGEDT